MNVCTKLLRVGGGGGGRGEGGGVSQSCGRVTWRIDQLMRGPTPTAGLPSSTRTPLAEMLSSCQGLFRMQQCPLLSKSAAVIHGSSSLSMLSMLRFDAGTVVIGHD